MADSVNYCSWLYSSFCITQSEWATWTQAGLTVATFAIALWRQESTRKDSEAKQEAAHTLRIAEKAKFDAIKARALGIAIESNLTDALSIAEVFANHPIPDSPKLAFDSASPLLLLRLRGAEVIDLGEAAEPMLKAVHAANALNNYLEIRKDEPSIHSEDLKAIASLSNVLLGWGNDAREALDRVLYPATHSADHAAS